MKLLARKTIFKSIYKLILGIQTDNATMWGCIVQAKHIIIYIYIIWFL